MLPQATADLALATRRRTAEAMAYAGEQWGEIDPKGDWARQWLKTLPTVVALVGASQRGSALDGAATVPAALEQSGFPERQLARVNPDRFAGWADPPSGPKPLEDYLYAAVIRARLAEGDPEEMLQAGGSLLRSRVHFAIADAASLATGASAIAHERTVTSWYDPPPYCQRCAILIGKRVSVAFRRHPQCDGALDVRSERDRSRRPVMDESEVNDLTKAQRKAIDQGADFNQVVNASRGVRRGKSVLSSDGRFTMYGSRGQRLTPRGIYQLSGDDRERALRLLQEHGYLIA